MPDYERLVDSLSSKLARHKERNNEILEVHQNLLRVISKHIEAGVLAEDIKAVLANIADLPLKDAYGSDSGR